MLELWASVYGNRCHKGPRCQCSMFHLCFQPTGGLRESRCMVLQQCHWLLAKEPRWTYSWFCLGTLHEFWRWAGYPFRTQFRHPMSASVGTLAGSRSFQPLFERHQGQNQRAQHLPCNDPWPNCYQHHFVLTSVIFSANKFTNHRKHSYQTRSCRVWRSDQTALTERNPSFPVPDPPKLL